MGLGDNRRSPKMSRKIRQRKKKDRLARRVALAKLGAKSSAKPAAAAVKKKAKKPVEAVSAE